MDIHDKIDELRALLGSRVTIVGHHYQSDEIIKHVDISGDSLELSQKVAAIESEHVIFCGVHFMGESAALLAHPGQQVHLPAPDADCLMAQMTPAELLDKVINDLAAAGVATLPLAYVNTSLAVKAVVGKHGGAVCTSSNAEKMLRWSFDRAEKVLFLPDCNLGRNVAKKIGMAPENQAMLDLGFAKEELCARPVPPSAGLKAVPKNARLLYWPGCCPIHEEFAIADVIGLRKEHPGIKIAVHPECPPEIVDLSDAAGSTSFLIRYAAEAPEGSTVAIGTEVNLVNRLAQRHAGRSKIIPLAAKSCADMAKVTPKTLLGVLEAIAGGGALHPVRIDQTQAAPARDSLTRMLEACK
jgi:quinolinate synthase